VVFQEEYTAHSADLSDQDPDVPVPDVIVPAGSTAIVDMNRLRQDGLIAVRLDDARPASDSAGAVK
jgi:hypothetical protein